jgi:hypothetical protein
MHGRSSITAKTRARPASPSCSAAFSAPSARTGRAAIRSAATNPVKEPTVAPPAATRQPRKASTAATASPPSASSTGSTRARVRAMA